MLKRLIIDVIAIVILISAIGCASVEGPTTPVALQNLQANKLGGQTHLWGYYDVLIDAQTGTVEAVDNRQATFTANVVQFLNGSPAGLSFKINKTPSGADYIDVDIDVSITHPFPGFPQYNGYDVRGVFMGNGSGTLTYNSDLKYPRLGTDQLMLPDPTDGIGGPDGYTRWYNLTEFSKGGMPLFQYTPGKMASPGFNGTATLCPYKYFADALGASADLWDWLSLNTAKVGRFSAGATNTRNYYLRFPNSLGIKYGYAIIASWESPTAHPSNAPEAVACSVVDKSDVYFISGSDKGGDISLDISLFDWTQQPSAVYVESPVLSSVHKLSASEMVPIGGGTDYSTWHVDIPADNVTQSGESEYWVIAEYSGFGYSNDFGVHNNAEGDPLAAFFRHPLTVTSSETNQPPQCSLVIDPSSPSMPFNGWGTFGFDASGSSDPEGGPLTYSWDFNADGTFGDKYSSGTDAHPFVVFDFTNQKQVCVKVTDNKGLESECCVDVDIIGHPSKNINLRAGVTAKDIAINPNNGDLLVSYNDFKVYKYPRATFYQSGSLFFNIDQSQGPNANGPFYIENSIDDNTQIATTRGVTNDPEGMVYGPTGALLRVINHGTSTVLKDAMTMNAGSYAGDLGMIYGEDYPYPPGKYLTYYSRYSPTNGFWPPITSVYQSYPPPYNGYSVICILTIVAAESDKSASDVWFIKNVDSVAQPDYYAARWLVSGLTLTYDNAYFGTGAKSDGDASWNDAKDITRDNKNRYFVLDQLSTGEPRVKVWTVSGNTTTSIGHFGDSTTISGAPLRIEGSDFEGNIVVLHGATSPQKISVFMTGEMP